MMEKKAWALVTRLGRTVLERFSEAQGNIHNEFDPSDLARTAALYWLAAVRTLDVMKEFQEAQFKDHPSLANTIVQYSLESNDTSEDDNAFSKKIKDLKAEINTKMNSNKQAGANALSEVKKDLISKINKCATKEELKKYQKLP